MSGNPSRVWICARGSTAVNSLGTTSICTRRSFAQRTSSIASSTGRSKNAIDHALDVELDDDLGQLLGRTEHGQAAQHVGAAGGRRIDEADDVNPVLGWSRDLPGDELGHRRRHRR